MKAIWNGKVLAESDNAVAIEGNYYFPPDSVRKEYLAPSETLSICPWKGMAHYHTVVVEGEENRDAAWSYPQPKNAARGIQHYIAFWKGVQVVP